MTTDALETLIGGYLAAWNEPDAIIRQHVLRQVWTDEGHYTDPQSDGEGRDALDQIIARFHKNLAGSLFSLNSKIDYHHCFVRFAWTLKLPNGSTMNGMDFGELSDDNRLCRIVGFF